VAGLVNVRSAALAHVLQRPALQGHASLQVVANSLTSLLPA
jgi:hypothetical protein